jgi:hypothetical protein
MSSVICSYIHYNSFPCSVICPFRCIYSKPLAVYIPNRCISFRLLITFNWSFDWAFERELDLLANKNVSSPFENNKLVCKLASTYDHKLMVTVETGQA